MKIFENKSGKTVFIEFFETGCKNSNRFLILKKVLKARNRFFYKACLIKIKLESKFTND